MNTPNTFTTDAEIASALLTYVVNPSGERPHLQVVTSDKTFYFVTILQPILPVIHQGKLTFVSFAGHTRGRIETFMWPPIAVEAPALGITELQVYEE